MNRRTLLATVLLAGGLAGCVTSHIAQPVEARTGARITSATVVFDESTIAGMPVRVTKTVPSYIPSKDAISDRDKVLADKRAKAVLDAYRQHAVRMMRAKLAAEGVPEGPQTEIALRPQWVSVSANNGHVYVATDVVVRQREATGLWKVQPVTNNWADAPYFAGGRLTEEVDADLTKLVDSFTSSAMRAMSQAGWFR